MILKISAILWSLIGFFTGSIEVFFAGGVACIALDIIKLSIGASNMWTVFLTYTAGYIFIGSWAGILFASIINNTVEMITPRIKELQSYRAELK
ncbi:hypothetical protein SAMN02745945_01963 [Peptoclostridium litorale DSM 5388]|uniref:Uncharacterized protein n=1 Tax=Peptoclostridium litorale DSM 5388 TaxID=1121324 RepID=A0A069RHH5_PEPLI|nr:hypothetical protein [Peptoclostridium litorale]KDR96233.1 hypothetical protein CLIT_4c00700 [Peptoclostridium litorale DSM 5388]SIO14133.1 hypothetical protein SAMN02745945_01963 [Peptoclostridium litorale DSM 5388]